MEDKDIKELSVERQKYQMHKKGYEDIVKAINNIPKTEIEIPTMDMTETNKILSELVKKMNEPICLTLKLK